MVVIGICLSCDAAIHGNGNVLVDEEVTEDSDNLQDVSFSTAHNISKTEILKRNTIAKSKIKAVARSGMAGLDLPIDVFTLHHPFIHSTITEFEYSQWYFLFFMFFDKPSAVTIDVTLAVPEITKSLSSKLSVAASVFSISRAEKYRTKSISANLSLTNHTIPRLHHRLCNLQNTSPLFWIRGTKYKLVQVIHDKNQHLYLRDDGQVNMIHSRVIQHVGHRGTRTEI